MNFKDNEYIVRVWPSGTITMGKVELYGSDSMFKSLEDYSEGGVLSGEIYGYISNLYTLDGHEHVDNANNVGIGNVIRHRKPLDYEISLFESRGYLKLSIEEQFIMKRDDKISQILS